MTPSLSIAPQVPAALSAPAVPPRSKRCPPRPSSPPLNPRHEAQRRHPARHTCSPARHSALRPGTALHSAGLSPLHPGPHSSAPSLLLPPLACFSLTKHFLTQENKGGSELGTHAGKSAAKTGGGGRSAAPRSGVQPGQQPKCAGSAPRSGARIRRSPPLSPTEPR